MPLNQNTCDPRWPVKVLKSRLVDSVATNAFKRRSLNVTVGTSLVVQWLRIHLPMQGTWVQSVVGEPTYHKATKPARPNYRSCNARTGEKHE